ncbi:hypothetical protein CTAYLR_001119 [Chrysophaeum taylorii]|uniref:O-fucosyltransferase family protein n=1 Tax=Chrysophaeum taylorii TaxID=2483200 RepID=A0AAD7UQL5_9STRA|nr:hypothetical protein CTAYLR_001119 [Chrysophaeum taylorii]
MKGRRRRRVVKLSVLRGVAAVFAVMVWVGAAGVLFAHREKSESPPLEAVAGRRNSTTGRRRRNCSLILQQQGMRYWSEIPEEMRSPYGGGGYVTFEPDAGGFNNVRMAFETVAVFAHATNRILVLPPRQRLYLLKQSFAKNPEAFHGIEAFLDLGALGRVVEIIDTYEFARREHNGLSRGVDLELVDRAVRTGEREPRRRLREWMRARAVTPRWDPLREVVVFGNCSAPDLPWREVGFREFAGSRRVREIDRRLVDAPWIHFASNASHGYRIFTHWYTFFLFGDGPLDAYYKRFARDRLRYRDEIACAAGRVARALGTSYSALHVRRGELQYVKVRIACDALNQTVSAWLRPRETLFILTDEKDRSWFGPLADVYDVRFMSDFFEVVAGESFFDPNALGMIEQLVAAAPNARTFTGTFFSTFSGYVARLRAYYGHDPASFFYAAPPEKRFVMHRDDASIRYPYFNREWPLGWRAIDRIPSRRRRRRRRRGQVEDNPSLRTLPLRRDYADLLPERNQEYPAARVQKARDAEKKHQQQQQASFSSLSSSSSSSA